MSVPPPKAVIRSGFSPIRLPTKGPVSGKDLNRVQDAIDAALKKLAADVQKAING